jgi:hypothetical protein
MEVLDLVVRVYHKILIILLLAGNLGLVLKIFRTRDATVMYVIIALIIVYLRDLRVEVNL